MPKRLDRSIGKLAVLLAALGMCLALISPQQVGAWPGDPTVNIQVHANASGLHFWHTIKCTEAKLQLRQGHVITGNIFDRRTNGCKAEFLNVPVKKGFDITINAVNDFTGQKYSGSLGSDGVGPQRVGRTAVLGGLILR